MKVFIVVLNWNRADDTIECLKSVQKLSNNNFQLSIIVVDNNSSGNSNIKIKNAKLQMKMNNRFQRKNFKLIENRENLGFAAGNNVGIRYALKKGADYVMILNNDTRIDPEAMNRFIETAKKYPDFGAFSPKIYFEKGFEFHKGRYKKNELGKVLWYAGGIIDWDNVYGYGRGVDEVDKGQYERIGETDFATGTCMFLRRSALERVGLFDEKYFMYYEDTDLSIRLKRKGFDVIYVPDAVLWHKVAQSSGIGSGLNDYFTTRNRLLFGMRYARLRTRFALYRESLKFIWKGRKWQRRGAMDFYLGRFGRGSWKDID